MAKTELASSLLQYLPIKIPSALASLLSEVRALKIMEHNGLLIHLRSALLSRNQTLLSYGLRSLCENHNQAYKLKDALSCNQMKYIAEFLSAEHLVSRAVIHLDPAPEGDAYPRLLLYIILEHTSWCHTAAEL